MASTGRSVLGIDINQYELRVVEARGSVSAPEIIRVGSAPMPSGAVDGDLLRLPEVVADTLKGLLNRMQVGTKSAVIGLGAQSTITRVLDVPRVPDSELRMVIEGELAHYQIVREGTGAFDYMRLEEPDSGPHGSSQVLLMAAEERLVGLFQEVADRAGLQLLALEPMLLAMYRTAFHQVRVEGAAALLSVTYGRSEVAIVDRGHLRLYRRVDIGSNDLVPDRLTPWSESGGGNTGAEGPILLAQEEYAVPPKLSGSGGDLVAGAANNLATEVQRSLDYYRREFPRAGGVTKLFLATNDGALGPLLPYLREALAMEAIQVEPPASPTVSRALASQFDPPAGAKYLGALGLAMWPLVGAPPGVPKFDLGSREILRHRESSGNSALVASLLATFALATIACVLYFLMGRQVAAKMHELGEMEDELLGKQKIEQAKIQHRLMQSDQLKALEKAGYSVPRIVDFVTAALDPMAGLKDVGIDRAGRLSIDGEATNEKAMINTLYSLQQCRFLTGVTLDNFGTKVSGRTQLVEFRINSQLVGSRSSVGMR